MPKDEWPAVPRTPDENGAVPTGRHRVFFLHVPKTAGTTLIRHLDRHFDPAEICPALTEEALSRVDPDRLASYRLIHGHFQYDFARLFPELPAVVTLVRDPVAHVLSHYAHMRVNDECYPEEFRVNGRSLAQVLELDAFRYQFSNVQTRYLGGGPTLSRLRTNGFGPEWMPRFEALGVPEKGVPDPRDCLDVARARLATFSCIGTTEHLAEFLWQLAYVFGWPPMADDVWDNRSADRPRVDALDPRTLAEIETLTALDRELYDFVRTLSRQRFRMMMEDLLGERGGRWSSVRAREELDPLFPPGLAVAAAYA